MTGIEDRLPPPLAEAFDRLAAAVDGLADPWWIFGGGALALRGVPDLTVPDVDVLTSGRDAPVLTLALGGARAAPAPGHFRSSYLGRAEDGLPVEVMADLAVNDAEGPVAIRFATREAVDWRGRPLFTPSLEEHAAVYRRFGRPKDLARAARLDAWLAGR